MLISVVVFRVLIHVIIYSFHATSYYVIIIVLFMQFNNELNNLNSIWLKVILNH